MMLVCSSTRDEACPQAEDFDKKASKMGRTISTFPIALSHRDVNENLGLKSDYTAAVEAFLRTLGIDLD